MKFILSLAIIFSSGRTYAGAADAVGAAGTAASTVASMVMMKAMLTGGANATMAGTMSGMCSGTQIWFCIAAGLSLAQIPLSLMSGKGGKSAAQALVPGGAADWDNYDVGNGLTGADVDSKFNAIESQYNKGTKDLAAKGIDVAKNSISTPKGSKPLSSMTSGKAMADAGLISVDQIPEADEVLKKAQDKLKQIAMNNSIGGGGGGGSSSRSPASFNLPATDYSSLFGEKEKPNAPKTAGLVKTIDGQPYGASVNNIFDMIRNRYEIKTREKTFVEN